MGVHMNFQTRKKEKGKEKVFCSTNYLSLYPSIERCNRHALASGFGYGRRGVVAMQAIVLVPI